MCSFRIHPCKPVSHSCSWWVHLRCLHNSQQPESLLLTFLHMQISFSSFPLSFLVMCVNEYVSSVLGQHCADVATHHCITHPVCLCLNRTRCRHGYASFDRQLLNTLEEQEKTAGKRPGIVPSAWLICHPGLATVWSLWHLSRTQKTIGNSLGHPAHQHLMLIQL